jgi:hypothetical protein
VTEPGVYDTLPEADYLTDPAFSASGAKRILPPGCPASFRWEQLHGRPPKPAFDFGHAVHSMVLGVGEPIVVIDADDWRKKEAKDQRDAAYAAGHVPLLTADHDTAKAAADAVRAHPIAGRLFEQGTPEQSLFWRDPIYGVNRRARLDWQTTWHGRHTVVDLKTCVSADPGAIGKAVTNYRYHQQQAFYLDALDAYGIRDAGFLFVFVEKDPPHLVTVCELEPDAVALGRDRNDLALALYADCLERDVWPSYADGVARIELPGWAYRGAA